MSVEKLEPMIRIGRTTARLLQGLGDEFDQNDVDHALAHDFPIYSMSGGMIISGKDLLDNQKFEDDPYAARVLSDR